jgi:RNA ligase (TIGR02306 family)
LKAVRLRGIFSCGLLVPNGDNDPVGTNVQQKLGIDKWDPDIQLQNLHGGNAEKDVGLLQFYDLDNLRKYSKVIQEGELVVVTEKIHGTSSAFTYSSKYDRLFVKSHKLYRKEENQEDLWWYIAHKLDLSNRMKNCLILDCTEKFMVKSLWKNRTVWISL